MCVPHWLLWLVLWVALCSRCGLLDVCGVGSCYGRCGGMVVWRVRFVEFSIFEFFRSSFWSLSSVPPALYALL